VVTLKVSVFAFCYYISVWYPNIYGTNLMCFPAVKSIQQLSAFSMTMVSLANDLWIPVLCRMEHVFESNHVADFNENQQVIFIVTDDKY
jgi:hypothetical protein